jgi:hyaluronan synthase
MLIGLLELKQTITRHTHLYLFTIFIVLTWALWVIKVRLSNRYRPWTADYDTTTSVVIPVVDEPSELFRDVLRRIVEQRPDQVVVVINGRRNPVLESVCAEFADDVEWLWTPTAGKRNAVRLGTDRSWGEIVLLVDSDTIWTPDTLSELRKPFADPTVGGATTRQRILDPGRSFLTRWADWLENTRALYSMPAQSVLGTVGCLPGRTIAFRRIVLRSCMHDFMTKKFLGVFMEVSDDRTLTNLTLQCGFRTVYQSTSLVYTDAPTTLKKMIKQQFRWARGSQYNTLRMTPWMAAHAPVLLLFFLTDIVLPFLWLATAIAWLVRTIRHDGADFYAGLLHEHGRVQTIVAIVLLTVLTSTLSMALRQLRHLSEMPTDLLRLPLFILFSTAVLMPIRIYGFFRLGHVGGWGTRINAHTARPDGGANPAEGAVLGSALPAPTGPASTQPAVVPAEPADGDPRGLLPYVFGIALLTLGVLYDARI